MKILCEYLHHLYAVDEDASGDELIAPAADNEPQPPGRGSFLSELLQETFPDAAIRVPKVVVVGEQSAGKTSLVKKLLVHSIQGTNMKEDDVCNLLSLLRVGTGMATKHPTTINLRRTAECKFWTNADEIEAISASRNTSGVAFYREVQITISGPEMPNLSFTDLPGLVTEDKPLGDDERLTVKSLVEWYISQPHTTLVVVETATLEDYDNSHVSPLLR